MKRELFETTLYRHNTKLIEKILGNSSTVDVRGKMKIDHYQEKIIFMWENAHLFKAETITEVYNLILRGSRTYIDNKRKVNRQSIRNFDIPIDKLFIEIQDDKNLYLSFYDMTSVMTSDELDVVCAMMDYKTDELAAESLGMSRRTLKRRVNDIYYKYSINEKKEAL